MFSEMIAELKQGRLPAEMAILQKRLDAALVKKIGVLKSPRMLWPIDRKINPDSRHLVWAAILVGDQAAYRLALDMVGLEAAAVSNGSGAGGDRLQLAEYMHEALLALAPDPKFRKLLALKIRQLQPAEPQPVHFF